MKITLLSLLYEKTLKSNYKDFPAEQEKDQFVKLAKVFFKL